MAVGKNVTWKKGKGSNSIFPLILRLLGRILSGEKDGKFGGKNRDKEKNWDREHYKVKGNFIHTWIIMMLFRRKEEARNKRMLAAINKKKSKSRSKS